DAVQARRVGLPVIVGSGERVPSPGRAWGGEHLHAGLALIGWLAERGFDGPIEAYDVSQRDARGRTRLVLRTAGGGRVVWGLPPGGEGAIEPMAERKLESVRYVGQVRGSIDAGGGVVDVTGAQIVVTPAGAATVR
ncbi:MAG: hypothetical protein AAF078_09210, partial [Planctomycetota bacterium]